MRSITHFEHVKLVLQFSDESYIGHGIQSAIYANHREKAFRLNRDGSRELLDGEPAGLVVFGTNKYDRPFLRLAERILSHDLDNLTW